MLNRITLALLGGVALAGFSLPSMAMTLPNTTAIEAAQSGGLILPVRDRDDRRGDRDDDRGDRDDDRGDRDDDGDDDGGRDN
jgi:hypothetical protein